MIYNKSLHRFAFFTAVCTGILIIAGALVTSTGSGLSVPDWPNTYGNFMFAFPLSKMVGGILYEHGHRMIASVVGFFILVLAFWLWRKESRKWVRVLGFLALGAVITQGILGGLTVLLLLPTAISVSHAALAQLVFSIVSAIALFTSKWWTSDQLRSPRRVPTAFHDEEKRPALFTLCIATTAAVFIQLILGAVMRHTQSGLVITDFPFAYGQLFPSLNAEALQRYTQHLQSLELRKFIDGTVGVDQILIHMAHRIWAIVAAGLVIWTSIRLINQSGDSKRFAFFAYALIALIVTQFTLGILTILTHKMVEITTAHVAAGAIVLITCVLTSLHVARLSGIRQPQYSFALTPKEIPA